MDGECPFTVEDSHFLKLNAALLRDPYPFYELIRAQGPAVREPEYGVHLVARYADVQHILRHPTTFSSIQNADAPYVRPPCPLDEIVEWRSGQVFADKLLTNDPPDHTRWRSLVNRFFTPRRVAALEPTLRAHVVELIEAFLDDGQVEFVTQFGDVLPRIVIGELVGLPREQIDKWREWFHPRVEVMAKAAEDPIPMFEQLLAAAEESGRADFLYIAEYAPALAEYFFAAVAEAKAAPQGDIIGQLANAKFKDGTEVPLEAIVIIVMTLFVAGADGNTPSLLTHCAMALAQDAGLQERLRGDPMLIEGFVEEVLRLESPIQGMFRTALHDTEVGGVPIKKGEVVMAVYAAANRDERVFAEPDRLDPERTTDHAQLAFGYGVHLCPGAALARMEARLAVEELLQRAEHLRLVDPADADLYFPSTIQRTPVRLRLAFDRR